MAVARSTGGEQIGRQATTGLEQRTLLGSVGLVGVVAMLLSSVWLGPSVAIGLSCALFVVGFAFAAYAWLGSIARDSTHATPWDVSGLLVFAGFAGLIGANTALF